MARKLRLASSLYPSAPNLSLVNGEAPALLDIVRVAANTSCQDCVEIIDWTPRIHSLPDETRPIHAVRAFCVSRYASIRDIVESAVVLL